MVSAITNLENGAVEIFGWHKGEVERPRGDFHFFADASMYICILTFKKTWTFLLTSRGCKGC